MMAAHDDKLVYVEIASSESEIDDDLPMYDYHPLNEADTIRILELHSDRTDSIEFQPSRHQSF